MALEVRKIDWSCVCADGVCTHGSVIKTTWHVEAFGHLNFFRRAVSLIKYLKVFFASEGTTERETGRRIGAATAVLWLFYRTTMTKRELSPKAKLSIYRSVFVPFWSWRMGHDQKNVQLSNNSVSGGEAKASMLCAVQIVDIMQSQHATVETRTLPSWQESTLAHHCWRLTLLFARCVYKKWTWWIAVVSRDDRAVRDERRAKHFIDSQKSWKTTEMD